MIKKIFFNEKFEYKIWNASDSRRCSCGHCGYLIKRMFRYIVTPISLLLFEIRILLMQTHFQGVLYAPTFVIHFA